jgi:hypothetical protein
MQLAALAVREKPDGRRAELTTRHRGCRPGACRLEQKLSASSSAVYAFSSAGAGDKPSAGPSNGGTVPADFSAGVQSWAVITPFGDGQPERPLRI